MSSVEYSERGTNVSRLPDKMRLFVDYYLVSLDATKAAISAGYSPKAAHSTGNKLLRDPRVKRAIGKASKELHEDLTLTTDEVLRQLYFIVTRDIRETVDEEGVMLPINRLSDRMAACVDGFDQEITEYTDLETGQKRRTIKNKLKLVGKAGAIDMAMKYQGLFKQDNEQKTTTVNLDFSKLFQPHIEVNDPVDKAMAHLEETAKNKVVIEVEPTTKKPSVKNEVPKPPIKKSKGK